MVKDEQGVSCPYCDTPLTRIDDDLGPNPSLHAYECKPCGTFWPDGGSVDAIYNAGRRDEHQRQHLPSPLVRPPSVMVLPVGQNENGPEALEAAQQILKELRNTRGFRQTLDEMDEESLKELETSFAQHISNTYKADHD